MTFFILRIEEVVKCSYKWEQLYVMRGPQPGAMGLRLVPLRLARGELCQGVRWVDRSSV